MYVRCAEFKPVEMRQLVPHEIGSPVACNASGVDACVAGRESLRHMHA